MPDMKGKEEINEESQDFHNDDDNSNDDEITEPEHLRKLFIGGLDYRTTDDGLKAHFEKWGKVVDVVVMKDPRTKRSRGFGFITYSRSSMIDAAQQARPHKIEGRVVEPKRAVPRQDIDNPHAGSTVKKLFVGGLKDEHDEECLRNYFEEFGNIVDINIVIDKDTGKKRGFAFIEYDDYDPVDKIILQKKHTIKNKLMDVKKALPKQDMNRQQGRSGGGGGGNVGRMGRGGNMGGGGQNGGWDAGQDDDWGCNGGGGNYGGGYNNGGGNNMGPWDNGNGNWNSGPCGSYGGPMNNMNNGNWNQNQDFGCGYQQSYGGGPQRGGGNYNSNRMQPYGNSGNGYGNRAGNNNYGNYGGNGPMISNGGGGNRNRY